MNTLYDRAYSKANDRHMPTLSSISIVENNDDLFATDGFGTEISFKNSFGRQESVKGSRNINSSSIDRRALKIKRRSRLEPRGRTESTFKRVSIAAFESEKSFPESNINSSGKILPKHQSKFKMVQFSPQPPSQQHLKTDFSNFLKNDLKKPISPQNSQLNKSFFFERSKLIQKSFMENEKSVNAPSRILEEPPLIEQTKTSKIIMTLRREIRELRGTNENLLQALAAR